MSPQLRLVAMVSVVVVLLLAAAAFLFLRGEDEAERSREVAEGIEDLQTFDDLGADHVPGSVDYEQEPPVGGDHFEVWLRCGVYAEPVPNEAAVHDLEHGAVWIAYDPDVVTDDDVATLTDALPEQGIMSPYPGLGAPVVVSAWERQVVLDGADDPRLAEFVEAFESGPQAPERTVGCLSGATLEELVELGAPPAPAA